MKTVKKENGEVMIEGIIVMVITMLVLLWVLGIGFIYYQRNVLVTVTNDAATKIAATYYNPGSDIIMGYVSSGEAARRDLYRNFNNNTLFATNQDKAKSYIKKRLEMTNFAGTIDNVDVKMSLVQDSPYRKHIEIVAKCTFNTPFSEALEVFGMNGKLTYEAKSRADCTDIIDYISTTDFVAYQTKPLTGGTVGSMIDSVFGLVDSLIDVFNRN